HFEAGLLEQAAMLGTPQAVVVPQPTPTIPAPLPLRELQEVHRRDGLIDVLEMVLGIEPVDCQPTRFQDARSLPWNGAKVGGRHMLKDIRATDEVHGGTLQAGAAGVGRAAVLHAGRT